jgi:class 3 adenylate cyclase
MRSALEGERKQVTVLFADVVGFSTLAGPLDPEDVHTLMDGCFEILTQQVHRYEGTINQFTGDGIMALFGAPLTHEDHAVRALHAALGIQGALADYRAVVQARWGVPVQMRFGVNTGLVVVGRIGDDLRMDYTAQGDTTNLAARLQQMAPAGAIWVGETTYRLARGGFDWQALGPQVVKGKAAPVPVYALHGPRLGGSRFEVVAQRGLTRFVGRDPELHQLVAAWEQTAQGAGRVVSVVGEAGIGKSRLLYEFKQWLAQADASAVEGSCFAYGDSISYLPFLAIVRGICGLEGREAEADAKRQIAQRLRTLPVDPRTVTPYLQNLLAFPVDDASTSLFLAWSVFTHLLEGDASFYLRELARVLRPDGVAITTWLLFDKRDFPVMQEFQNALFVNDVDPTNAVYFDKDWLLRSLADLGLVITRVRPPRVRGFQWLLELRHDGPGVSPAALPSDEAPHGLARPPLLPSHPDRLGLE